MRRIAVAALSLVALVACQPAAVPLSDADLAAIRNLGPAYAQANLAKDADGVVALYAEDAIEMPPNEPATVGKAAIRDRYAGYFALDAETTEFTVTSEEVDGAEGLAYDRGTWTWTGTAPGMAEPTTDTGKYIGIVRRQPGGTWLWTAVIWNSDLPLPESE